MGQQGGQISVAMQGRVAVLSLARAPSNALSSDFCAQIQDAVTDALHDDGVAGLVIASKLAVFSAGSDVGDILDPTPNNRAALQALCRTIAQLRKPVVAAVGGACLSTGLDLALAAAARVGGARSSFGFPDIRLGSLPAGGGCFRSARVVGVKNALRMVLTGDGIPAEEALELGLIDRLCSAGAEVDQAAALVMALAAQTAPNGAAHYLKRRDFAAHLRIDMAAVAEARAGLPPQAGHWSAHHRAVDACEAALLLPEAMALVQEATSFDELQRGPIARALSYAFVTRQRAAASPSPQVQTSGQPSLDAALRRVMGEVVTMFQLQGLPRRDILAALSSFGIAAAAADVLPECPPDARDVVPALLAAWANAGAMMLRTGQVRRPDQIDNAALTAGMCPNWRGGPMYLAGLQDAAALRRDLERRAKSGSPAAKALFTPDPLWTELIDSNLPLRDVEVVIEQF